MLLVIKDYFGELVLFLVIEDSRMLKTFLDGENIPYHNPIRPIIEVQPNPHGLS